MNNYPNRKRSIQGCILSPCLFHLYEEYIMRNAGLEEAQAGIKIGGRNIHFAVQQKLMQHCKIIILQQKLILKYICIFTLHNGKLS